MKKIRKCNICGSENVEFPKNKHHCINCVGKRRCFVCKNIKNIEEFNKDKCASGGISYRCKSCSYKRKLTRNEDYRKRRREYDKMRKDRPERKLRMFIKDCFRRLKNNPNTNIDKILGFSKEEFLTKFPNIPSNYDIDHMIPLSWFKNDTPISISCSLHNLQILERSVNIKKKNKFYHKPTDNQYFINSLPFIKEKYLQIFKNACNLGAEGWE